MKKIVNRQKGINMKSVVKNLKTRETQIKKNRK